MAAQPATAAPACGRSCRASRDRRGPGAAARRSGAAVPRRRPRGGRLAGDADEAPPREPTSGPAVADIRMPPTHTEEGLGWPAGCASTIPRSACWCSPSTCTAASSTWSRHGGFGYLLKDRVLDVADFLDAAERVADGGSALDPEWWPRSSGATTTSSAVLSAREREVLGLMAEGLTNAGIAAAAGPDRADRREPHPQRVHEARPAGRRRRPSAGARGAVLPAHAPLAVTWQPFRRTERLLAQPLPGVAHQGARPSVAARKPGGVLASMPRGAAFLAWRSQQHPPRRTP